MGLKNKLRVLKYKIKDLFLKNPLNVSWDQGTNFGDAFNPYLLKKLSGKNINWVHRNYYYKEYLMCIGSILQKANSNALIWGSGLISADSVLKEKPKHIYAVRGPKTRERLLELGIACPEIYGDPALLIPIIYKPEIQKKYKLGIIPHYVDKSSSLLNNFKNNSDVLILDIKMKDHYSFIDNVLSCEKIVSSSLHGIILADAYKIPSMWIELSKKVKGDGFKFIDYFLSVKRKDNTPYKIEFKTTVDDLYDIFYDYTIDIDLKRLLDSFPFETNIKL